MSAFKLLFSLLGMFLLYSYYYYNSLVCMLAGISTIEGEWEASNTATDEIDEEAWL